MHGIAVTLRNQAGCKVELESCCGNSFKRKISAQVHELRQEHSKRFEWFATNYGTLRNKEVRILIAS